MNEIVQEDIVQQLVENTERIISSGPDVSTKELSALACRQKFLNEALHQSFSRSGAVSPTEVTGLKDLVNRAIETVKTEIGKNRGSMQATGIKKKMLSAYGTVTVSGTSSK